MSIYLHHTTIVRDGLTARYGGARKEFAVIELDMHTDLSLHSPAECDELIKAAVEAKRLLSPPVTEPEPVCPALSDDGALCTADHHPHQMPHRDRNGAEWAGTQAPEMCDATRPLRHGGEFVCVLNDGHYGAHQALNGTSRWLGTGADARDESGARVAPEASRA